MSYRVSDLVSHCEDQRFALGVMRNHRKDFEWVDGKIIQDGCVMRINSVMGSEYEADTER